MIHIIKVPRIVAHKGLHKKKKLEKITKLLSHLCKKVVRQYGLIHGCKQKLNFRIIRNNGFNKIIKVRFYIADIARKR